MPITFESENTSDMSYVRVNLPQNKWTIKTPTGDIEEIDMSKGIAIDIKNVVFGWLHIDVGVREFLAWPSPAQPLEKPEGSPHKKGFEVDCWANGREAQFSNNSFGAGSSLLSCTIKSRTILTLRLKFQSCKLRRQPLLW